PARSVQVALVPYPDKDDVKWLQCTSSDSDLAFPADGEPVSLGMGEVRWYANDPPVFSSQNQSPGYVTFGDEIVFEGCRVSRRLANPAVEVGPDGLVALYTDERLLLIQHGRVVATGPGATIVRFAPR